MIRLHYISKYNEVITVNNGDSNKQSGADSEQRNADVLRAKDIIPPLKAPAGPAPDTQQAGEKVPPPPAVPSQSQEQRAVPSSFDLPQPGPKPVSNTPASPPKAEQAKSEVPRFDLAEKIMAEQRRITAVRRKGPGQEETQEQEKTEPVGGIKKQVPPALSEEEQIIADIVARDIGRLCKGHISSVSE
jgi:hypothetical protein